VTLQSAGADAPEIQRLGPWFHNLHLPNGTETAPDHPLGDFPAVKWEQIANSIPADLTGWRAVDIGCNAGFYSFELARRGARVVAIDHDEHYLRQARWAAPQFGVEERITLRRQSVYDLGRTAERFDLILFMGVLYHLRHPLLALDLVAEHAEKLVVLQTLTLEDEDDEIRVRRARRDVPFRADELVKPGWPTMAFVEKRLAGDPTNWWVPNHAAVEAMMRSTGLEVVERPGHEIFLCVPKGMPRRVRAELLTATGRA
jgi:tRNA (mo5U34)-methyltransferase